MGTVKSKTEDGDTLPALFRIQTEDEVSPSLWVEIISWFSLERVSNVWMLWMWFLPIHEQALYVILVIPRHLVLVKGSPQKQTQSDVCIYLYLYVYIYIERERDWLIIRSLVTWLWRLSPKIDPDAGEITLFWIWPKRKLKGERNGTREVTRV